MKTFLQRLYEDEEGLGTLELLLIVAVLVAIAIVFREYIINWVNSLFSAADTEMNKVGNDIDQLERPGG